MRRFETVLCCVLIICCSIVFLRTDIVTLVFYYSLLSLILQVYNVLDFDELNCLWFNVYQFMLWFCGCGCADHDLEEIWIEKRVANNWRNRHATFYSWLTEIWINIFLLWDISKYFFCIYTHKKYLRGQKAKYIFKMVFLI